jgi:hypothetical protein
VKKKWTVFVECPPPPWEVVEAKDTKNKIHKAKFCWSGKPLEEYKIPALTVFVAWRLP